MSAYNKFQCFVGDVAASGIHDLVTGTTQIYKVYLTNAQPVVTNTTYNTPADLAAGNGYTAGGASIGTITGVDSAGTFSFAGGTNPTWTAAGGNVGPFEWAILYNSNTNRLISWWDYGTAITLTNGNTFTVELPNPILTLA